MSRKKASAAGVENQNRLGELFLQSFGLPPWNWADVLGTLYIHMDSKKKPELGEIWKELRKIKEGPRSAYNHPNNSIGRTIFWYLHHTSQCGAGEVCGICFKLNQERSLRSSQIDLIKDNLNKMNGADLEATVTFLAREIGIFAKNESDRSNWFPSSCQRSELLKTPARKTPKRRNKTVAEGPFPNWKKRKIGSPSSLRYIYISPDGQEYTNLRSAREAPKQSLKVRKRSKLL